MATFAELLVRIGGDATQFQATMDAVSTRLDEVVKEADKSLSGFDKLGSRLSSIGASLTAALTLPLAGVGIATTKMAADFELGMRRVTSLLGSVSEREFRQLSDQTLELSKRLGVDAVGATNALYEAISAGIPKENALSFMEVASKAAIAGVTDTKTAVDGLTNIMNAFGISTTRTQEVADAMFQAVNVGKFTFGELASAVGLASGSAAKLGVDFKELLGSAATITKQGFSVSEAMTSIQSAMMGIITPNKAMNQLLDQMGVASGEALLKSRGLQGALQDLSAATGGSNQQLAEALGRVEALRAALALTGDKSRMAAEDLKVVRDSAGAAAKAFEEIDKSTQRQFERLTNELKASAIELGTALLPAVNQLLQAAKPMVELIADAVRWFSELSPAARNAGIAIAGLAAAIGPAVLAIGGLISQLVTLRSTALALSAIGGAQLAPLAASATGATGAVSGLLTALGSVAGVAGVGLIAALKIALPIAIGIATAAFATWKLDSAITQVEQLTFQLELLDAELRRASKATEEEAVEIGVLEEVLRRHGKEVDRAGLTTKEYLTALRGAVAGLEDFKGKQVESSNLLKGGTINLQQAGKEYENLTPAIKKTGISLADAAREYLGWGEAAKSSTIEVKKSVQTHADLEKQVRLLEERYKAVAAAYMAGTASAQELRAAHDRLKEAQDALDPDKLAEKYLKASEGVRNLSKDNAEFIQKLEKQAEAHKKTDEEWNKFQESVASGQVAENFRLIGEAAETVRQRVSSIEVPDSMKVGGRSGDLGDLIRQTEDLQNAEKTLGLERVRSAADAVAAYEKIRNSGLYTAREVLTAERAALKAKVDEARAAGDEITEEDRKRLEELDRILGEHVQKQKSKWRELLDDLKGVFRSFNRDMASIFVSLFTGDKENDRLKQEEADLKASLATREQEWIDYQATIEQQRAELHESVAAWLAKEEAEIADSLAEREQEYAEYAAEVSAQIEQIYADHAKQAAEEIAEVQETLAEKEQAYEEYKQEVFTSIDEIREKHREELADELEDLADNLADRTQAYEDFVADANRSIERLRSKSADDIGDETRSTKRKIAEKQKDYSRDEQDILKRIERLKAAGKKENDAEIQDLRQQLARKKEDLEEYIREAEEDLADYVEEHKLALQQEEEDYRTSLDRRTRDFEDYKKEYAKKVEEATKKHAEEENKQVKDLEDSLKKRTEDLEKYRTDAEEKIVAITKKHDEQARKEEQDLIDSLNRKRGELDKYRADCAKAAEDRRKDAEQKLKDGEKDLEDSLGEHLKDLEKYRTDTAAKLEEIRKEYQSVWDKIQGAFGDMLTGIGTSLAAWAIEQLEKTLLKSIFDTVIAPWFGKISAKVGELLGIGGGTGGATTVPKTGGTGTSGSGGGAGGGAVDMSWASIIGGAISAFGTGLDIGATMKWGSTQENTYLTFVASTRMLAYWHPLFVEIRDTLYNIYKDVPPVLSNIYTVISQKLDTLHWDLVGIYTNDQNLADQSRNANPLLTVLQDIRTITGETIVAALNYISELAWYSFQQLGTIAGLVRSIASGGGLVAGASSISVPSAPASASASGPVINPFTPHTATRQELEQLLFDQQRAMQNPNAGQEYLAWLVDAQNRTRDALARINDAAVGGSRPRFADARITVNVAGGSSRDQEFATYVINQFVREAKAGGLL